MKEELFRLEYIDVSYNNSLILNQFSMVLNSGEILGIYTKNFSETDCLIDTLCGDLIPDSGRIIFKGEPLHSPNSPIDIKTVVIGKQSQLIDNFNVAENIFVIRKGFKKRYINKRKLENQADLMLKKIGFPISAGSLISSLSTLEKILVEIARAYILRVPVVIFKNLSSFLADEDLKKLYGFMELFKNSKLTLIVLDSTGYLIEHFCGRVILLSRGRNIWTFRSGEFRENLLSSFFKVANDRTLDRSLERSISKKSLELKNISTERLNCLNISINRGEIIGLVDLEGIQINELKKIFMEQKKYFGEILISGTSIKQFKYKDLLKKGLAIIDEDPSKTTLFSEFSAIDNLSFPLSSKVPLFWQKKKYRINILKKYESFFSEGILSKSLSHLGINDLHSLSYLKWHLFSPDFIILVKPFSSVDRQLEELTISLIDMLIQKGIGILILTSNIWELSRLSAKQDITIQRLTPLT